MKIVAHCSGSGLTNEQVATMLEEIETVAMRYRPFVHVEASVNGGKIGLGEVEHPGVGREDWKRQVSEGSTNLSYGQWVEEQKPKEGECGCIACRIQALIVQRLGGASFDKDMPSLRKATDEELGEFTAYVETVKDDMPLMSFSEWQASRAEQSEEPGTRH